jgi:hypothetical protein
MERREKTKKRTENQKAQEMTTPHNKMQFNSRSYSLKRAGACGL